MMPSMVRSSSFKRTIIIIIMKYYYNFVVEKYIYY